MKALLLEGKDQLVYTDVPEPEPVGERPVLVRVAAVSVCGSDMPRYLGKAYHYPLILGHEFSAVVEQSFPGGRYKKGDRVAVYPLLPNPRDKFQASPCDGTTNAANRRPVAPTRA